MLGRLSTHHNLGRRAAIAAAIATAGLLCTVQVAGAYPAPPGETATVTTISPAVLPGSTFTVSALFLLANGQPNRAIQGVTFVMTCVPTSPPVTVQSTTNSAGLATATFTSPSHPGVCTIVATAADGTRSQTTVRNNLSVNAGLIPGGPGNTGGGAGAPSGGLPIAADAGIGVLILLAGGATVVLRRRHSATS